MFVTRGRRALSSAAAGFALLAVGAGGARAQQFTITNLVSDGSVSAVTVDPSLINPWGMSYTPGGPFWVSNNGSGTSTLYTGAGAKQSLTVTIPAAGGGTGPGSPTGQVYNASSSQFKVTSGGKSGAAPFIFDTEDGTISGWAPSVNSGMAVVAVDNSAEGAVYKGLALVTFKSGKAFLYATNFRAGDIEMYNANFKLTKSFTDATIPAGYAPYNVQVLGKTLYVTFAKQDKAKHDSVSGAGFGYVDAFSLAGKFIRRVVSNGPLNAPWGLDLAPSSFGAFAGDLLVGNFGDGWINAFDPVSGAYKGALESGGGPIAITDLWGLITGNGGSGGDADTVYFTAGLAKEKHGLFGSLTVAGATPRR
jgi:uncharacterized protein (TIGR03118 family)